MFNITRIVRTMAAAVVMALFCQLALAQTRVSGTVVDETGAPLAGASVIEVGTTNGTITDVDGAFVLTAKEGATLSVSFIGFLSVNATVPADGKLTVTLAEDKNLLNEVVVVGYGTMARKDVTSSITTLRADDLDKGVFTDAASMLQGKVAGLVITQSSDPNAGPSITLRGASSLRGGAMSPYYVIDGIPGVDISMVAPDDIESIDVLRDATATAIYGSKAANGVIIVTTKKGKKGQERVNVAYSGYAAFDNVLKTYDVCTADDLREYAKKNGITLKDGGSSTDWQKEVLRTAISHNHNVSINGGSKKTTYMASANFIDRQGVVKGDHMNRLNVRSLVTTKVFKEHLELSVGANMLYAKHQGVSKGEKGASVLDAMNYFSPTNALKDKDDNWTIGAGSKNYNPMSMIYEDTSETIWKRAQFIGKATAYIWEGLTWSANYSYNNYQSTYSGYDTRKSQLEGIGSKNGYATRNTYFGDEHTFETYGNYDGQFGDHKIGVMAGYSWEQKRTNDGFGVSVEGFYNDNLKWNNLSYANTIQGITAVQSGYVSNVRNISFYGRLSYSYASRYMIQATVRRDGSSVFGANNRWGTFPSVSVAWNIAEENFMKNQDVVSQLKFRVGYGVSGNAMGFDPYSSTVTYGATGMFQYDGKDYRTFAATKNANPDLKWESTGMFNVGIDYGFLDGRVSGSVEFYNKRTKDLIWAYPVSTTLYPYGWIDANVGEINNMGVEFSINATAVKAGDFQWNTTFNIAHNSNKVIRLSNDTFKTTNFTQGDPDVAGVSANGYTQRIIEGEPLGTFYTYEFAGVKDGLSHYYVLEGDGVRKTRAKDAQGNYITTSSPTEKDRTVTGCAQPLVNLGWNNNFTYKNWSLSMFFNGVFGQQAYNSGRAHYTAAQMFSDGKNVLKEFLSYPVGDATSAKPSDRYIEDASFLRLQTLTLSYTFRNMADWLQSIQLYATCNNVFTITGYKGLDPEVNLGGLAPGVDFRWSTYPRTRTFLIGAKINF